MTDDEFEDVKRLSAARCLVIWLALSALCWAYVAGVVWLLL
jgi:hypothetical protein